MIKNSFYLEVNRDAILHNIEVLRKWKKKDIIPVIKANAYGHGAIEMAKTCIQAGITQVAVARYEEARHILEDSYFQRLSETVPFQILVFESMGDDSVIKAFRESIWPLTLWKTCKRHWNMEFLLKECM
ncbi:Alanine racemase [Fusobacterium necrophorum subsp. necrophorum]|nr:Alanine racemase [Fusobacterium necrophorum subsp. necrophorum]